MIKDMAVNDVQNDAEQSVLRVRLSCCRDENKALSKEMDLS